jgi:hypothetical protein
MSASTSPGAPSGRCALQKAAPVITVNYSTMSFASHDSGGLLLGPFQVSILHNIVHLLIGVAGILRSRSFGAARAYLIGGGVIPRRRSCRRSPTEPGPWGTEVFFRFGSSSVLRLRSAMNSSRPYGRSVLVRLRAILCW